MKLIYCLVIWRIFFRFMFLVKCNSQIHNFGHPKFSYASDQDYRLYTQSYPYSNTEFDHALHDERCGNRLYEPKHITKETSYGNFIGRLIHLCDTPGTDLRDRPGQPGIVDSKTEVRVFLGIPYAEPPIRRRHGENLQFKPPQEHSSTTATVIDASRYKPACPQHNKYFSKGQGINTTSEDCLYLNIFTPVQSGYDTTQELHAVMIYIHDGNFDHGSGSLFPAHMLAASQRVVVVTFNYRLGPLGFLATADEKSPGNYGMLDQIKALKWVYENIKVFDGDSRRITLFGSGAGGVSAALLALSPLSKRMIKRVIAQNGSPVADWAAISDKRFMENTTEIIGQRLGCNHLDTLRLVDCVGTRLNEIKILEMKPRIGWLPWGPVLDNFTRSEIHQFLPKSPQDILEGVLFPDGFAYMTGVNRDQGASIFLEDFVTYGDLEINSDTFNDKIRSFMKMYNYSINAGGIFDAIKFMYQPPVDPLNKTLLREAYIHLLTDRYYVAPMENAVQLMLKNKVPTYAYVLNYTLQGYSTVLKDFVSSETDYLLLSGAPFMDPKYYPDYLDLKSARWTEEDRNMSQFMMEAWANFAKEGIPTRTRIFNTILWEKVNENNLGYLNLNATNTTSEMIYNYRERESRFWNSLLPFFIDREPPTLAPTLEPGVAELRLVTSALWGSTAVASLLVIVTLVCCILYCRIRRKRPVEDLNSSREVIVNFSAAHQDTSV